MSWNELPPDLKETVFPYLQLFKIAGFNVFDDENKGFIRKYGRLIFTSLMFILMTILVAAFVFIELSRTSFLNVADSIPSAVLFIQDMVGFLPLMYKKDEIKSLIFDIAEVWPTDLGDNKMKAEIKKNWLRRMAVFTRANFVVLSTAMVCYYIPPMMMTLYVKYVNGGTVYLFPFNMYYFCENNTALYSYLPVYVFEIFFSMSLHLCTHVTCNLLLAILSCNVSLMLRLLQIDLENVLEASDGRTVLDEDKLKNIIRVHQKLLRLIEKLNQCFGVLLLISVCFSSLIIALFAFLTSAVDKKYLAITFSICFEIFNLCWPGQLLEDMSYGVAEAAYGIQWYSFKMKGFISIIIQRSQKPAHLSAWGYSNLTLTMFSKILSTAWSYLSLLSSTNSNRHT